MRQQEALPGRATHLGLPAQPDGAEWTFVEVPVFTMSQGADLTSFLAGEACTPADTLVRLVPSASGGFYKDGVLVRSPGDRLNADCRATACGCLYRFKDENACWPFVHCGPQEVVWRQALPDWRERHAHGDWSTVDADRPEVAPWLQKEEPAA